MRTADWYFDFVSPYSYLQCERLDVLAGLAAVRPRPVLFAGLLERWGQKGPAEIASKRTFTYRQVVWRAARDRIELRFPPAHPFNPIRALRLVVSIGMRTEEGGDVLAAIRETYRFIWRDGNALDDEGFARLCKRLGVSDGPARVSDPAVKDALRANGEAAIAAGVFGVPTLAIDGHLFWGYDNTDMALDYLRDPARFESAEMQRLDALPVAASRL